MSFKEQDRQKAWDNSRTQRRKQQKQRRVKVREMVDAGMAKTKIAKELGVNLNTIYRDLQAKEGESDA